jgi:ribonuclease T1
MKSIKKIKKWSLIICAVFLLVSFAGCQSTAINDPAGTNVVSVKEGQSYSTKDEVAAYINEYHKLPPNYITKAEAQKLGWDNSKGNLWIVTNKMSIGGDRFGNLEGLLPKAKGRQYYECDIDYYGGYRGAERIIYSSDGLIFYTDDHYKTFIQLY